MKKLEIPVKEIPMPGITGTQAMIGPGSQPADSDGAEISFMNLPSGMSTFESPILPEPDEIGDVTAAMEIASEIQQVLANYSNGDKARTFELGRLDSENIRFINQLAGDGEVSIQCRGALNVEIQESVLAGVWRCHYLDENKKIIRDTLEIGAIPAIISELTFFEAKDNFDVTQLQIPEDVYNAPPLLTEISDKLNECLYDTHIPEHIINLSLLPHTEADIHFLAETLGVGNTIILSRGYGNCRISSTQTRYVWWVQYFNSQDTLILNTLEISKVPRVALASEEDLHDSADRLDEILSLYRD